MGVGDIVRKKGEGILSVNSKMTLEWPRILREVSRGMTDDEILEDLKIERWDFRNWISSRPERIMELQKARDYRSDWIKEKVMKGLTKMIMEVEKSDTVPIPQIDKLIKWVEGERVYRLQEAREIRKIREEGSGGVKDIHGEAREIKGGGELKVRDPFSKDEGGKYKVRDYKGEKEVEGVDLDDFRIDEDTEGVYEGGVEA